MDEPDVQVQQVDSQKDDAAPLSKFFILTFD